MPNRLGEFTVPVDVQRLRALRKAAGFKGARAFDAYLKSRGCVFNYRGVEQDPPPSRGRSVNRVKSETAEAIAEALGVEPDEAFPEYSAAKAEMERHLREDRYKPFTTLAERNAAIVDAMAIAKWTAWKCAANTCESVPIGRDEALSCAYETLVETADMVMKWGLPKGVPFQGYVCRAIKTNMIVKYLGRSGDPIRKFSFCSLEAFTPDFLEATTAPDPEELYILRETLEELQNGGKSCP